MINPQTAPEPILEATVLARLATLGGGKLLRQLVELFEQGAPPRVAAIRRAQSLGDAKEVEREAHALKASAGNLGAIRVQVLCQHLETCGSEGEVGSLGPATELLEEEVGLLLPRLRHQLEGLEP